MNDSEISNVLLVLGPLKDSQSTYSAYSIIEALSAIEDVKSTILKAKLDSTTRSKKNLEDAITERDKMRSLFIKNFKIANSGLIRRISNEVATTKRYSDEAIINALMKNNAGPIHFMFGSMIGDFDNIINFMTGNHFSTSAIELIVKYSCEINDLPHPNLDKVFETLRFNESISE